MKIIPRSLPLSLSGFLLILMTATQVHAKILMDMNEDFRPPHLKPGFRLLWNPENVEIGNSSRYQQLYLTSHNYYIADNRYEPGPHSESSVARWLRVYRITKNPNKAPESNVEYDVVRIAPGDAASAASDKLDHYVIISYTLQPGEAGNTSITESTLTRIRGDEAGKIKVYVNDRLIGEDELQGVGPSQFNAPLGYLNVGDTIYIALGPSKTASIGWVPKFKIESN